jgi:formylglycine-generating enzyme required for sulfatase activity
MKTIQHIALLAAGLLAASSATAAIIIDTVQVGNIGNANDSTTGGNYGGVDYDYHIGTYEVTNSQYTAFLNATAATDNHSLYNSNMGSSIHGGINREGSSGRYTYSVKSGFGDKPVNFVSFWDAARFSNWLTTGDTETGVYNLNGTTSPSSTTIIRDATAWANGGVAVASENEWYKAAYYDGDGGYTKYPTNSDSITTDDANYDNSVGTVSDVGSYASDPSYYGTFDQGGNVWEWYDTIVTTNNRGLRGGSFFNGVGGLRSSGRGNIDPAVESNNFGFRVSSLDPIPEPSAYAAILGCLGLALALMRRKGRGTL